MNSLTWLVRPRSFPEAAWQLFCLPPAGGGVATYSGWSDALGPEIEVTAVCPPGRERNLRVEPYRDMDRLVEELTAAVLAEVRGPYALFGHSFGAVLAFEVAARLGHNGSFGPARLFVSACAAPHLPRETPQVHLLDDVELLRVLSVYGGVPDGLADIPELIELVLPAVRADLEMSAAYSPGSDVTVTCAISALGGLDDPAVQVDDLDKWRELTAGSFVRRLVPGGHFYLAAQLPFVIEAVRRDLIAVSARPCTTHRAQGVHV